MRNPRAATAALVACIALGSLPGWPSGAAQAGPPVTPTAPVCLGPHDLIIDGTQIALSGEHTFDQVCIVNGATLLARNLTPRAGVVFLDATSHIDQAGRVCRMRHSGCRICGCAMHTDLMYWRCPVIDERARTAAGSPHRPAGRQSK